MKIFRAKFSDRSVGVLAPTERRCLELLSRYEDATPGKLDLEKESKNMSPRDQEMMIRSLYEREFPQKTSKE